MKRVSGFTLAELLVVVTIGGIVAAAVVPSLTNQIRLIQLKQGQQMVFQAIKQAQSLARAKGSAYSAITIQFFDKTSATPNRYRICDGAPGVTCTGANWAPGTVTNGIPRIAIEQTLPAGIDIAKVYPVATPYFSFDYRGNIRSSYLGTVVVGVANLPSSFDPTIGPALTTGTTLSTAVSGCPTTLESCIADANIGANYKAVDIMTILGKVRTIQ